MTRRAWRRRSRRARAGRGLRLWSAVSCAMRSGKASTGPEAISAAKSPLLPAALAYDRAKRLWRVCRTDSGTQIAPPVTAGGARTEATSMATPKYRRVIVKLSGEALSGPEKFGINQPTIDRFAADLVASHALGIGLGIVVGGGNILRGAQISEDGLSRPTADAMGMLATVMNALVLEAAIERAGVG